ncbi:hypothetical protein IW140_005416 [Coemansia sp. RSA 1813]|nr:hypothetical protein EV178_005374 [Coemansia sp. RSA 1646]KAJ1767733.1 hypothetical protein LPJ74_005207 [Coemansia sp. RSA 1843]KAJ2086828.1 hypothetical protein IW138_005395 [Coemansia sp. RSA 986]KAJ2211593.1 hypothetical protein EV179_005359 [Coemansia sp. RSA 487]KAJ2565205.1 hypothetical protein IW140_005416 [Coemansia sp. RSA 1813]
MKFFTASAAIAVAATAVSADTIAPTMGQHLCCAANQARAQAVPPIAPLKWLPSIDTIATSHSKNQMNAGAIDHFEPYNAAMNTLGQRLASVGFDFQTAGENIGSGYGNVSTIQKAWMESPGHKANILGTGFTVCGGGSAFASPYDGYFTVDFASALHEADDATFYTLNCNSAGLSNGAYKGGSAPAASTTVTPDAHAAKSSAVVAATPSPVAAASSTTAKEAPLVSDSPAPAATESPVSESPAPVVPAPAPGKCKRVPKGSIAAGKCKACTKCASANRRR